jgi:uncharacterized protein YuzE
VKIRYFKDTDTLYIEFRDVAVTQSRDLDENTLADVDENGEICAITIEHAARRAGAPKIIFEEVAA